MTFAEMYARLAEELQDSDHASWTLARKKEYLNEANVKYHHLLYEYDFLQYTAATITTASGTQAYSLPTGFQSMIRMWRDGEYELTPDLDRQLGIDSSDTGEPLFYSIQNAYKITGAGPTTSYAQVAFMPIPDAAYTINYEYFPAPDEMTRDTDVSSIPVSFHDLIILDAQVTAYRKRGQWDFVNALKGERNERKQELIEFLSRRIKRTEPILHNGFAGVLTVTSEG